jgi:aryl-alcohol dehydrogenase-like predicted oxidoreductase
VCHNGSSMPAIKMTFSLPPGLAERLLRQVPSRERSRYVAAALEASLRQRDAELIRACQLANADPEVAAIEHEMDALNDAVEEPWDESPAR